MIPLRHLLLSLALPLGLLSAEPSIEKIDLYKKGDAGYALYRIPGIAVTSKGTVLVYCEARKSGGGDWGEIEVHLRRSTDQGKTWSDSKQIAHFGERIHLSGVKGTKETEQTVNNPVIIADRDGTVHLLYCINYARCYYLSSADDGLTWSKPVEITSAFESYRPDYPWNVIATGPGHGVQLQSGRLVVPVWLCKGTGGAHRPSVTSTIYSDDHGKTWKAGQIAVPNTETWVNPNETVAVPLADGGVMLNVRSESSTHRRLVVTSPDGATQWSEPRFDPALLEPICMGSIVRVSTTETSHKNRILFANPDRVALLPDGTENPKVGAHGPRENLTLKLSYDEGQTWPISKSLEPGGSGYSDLATLPDGTILCFYERTAEGKGSVGLLTLARFNLEWLTDGKDTLKPKD